MDECSLSSLADAIRRPAAHVAWRFAVWRGGVLRPRKMAGVRCERTACAATGNETGAEIKSGLATAASPRLAAASRAAARTGTAARAENMKCLAAGSFERGHYQPLDPTRQAPHSGPSSRRSDAAMSWSARPSDLRSGFAAVPQPLYDWQSERGSPKCFRGHKGKRRRRPHRGRTMALIPTPERAPRENRQPSTGTLRRAIPYVLAAALCTEVCSLATSCSALSPACRHSFRFAPRGATLAWAQFTASEART
jgi:hypothetical protein